MVEAAFVVPLLIVLLLGFTLFTTMIKDSMIMQTAAREGARYYSATNDFDLAEHMAWAVIEEATIDFDPNRGDCIIATSHGSRGVGITIEKNYHPHGFFNWFFGGSGIPPFTMRRTVYIHRMDR